MLKSERQKLPGCMWNIPGYTLAEGKGRVDTQDNTAKGKMLNRGYEYRVGWGRTTQITHPRRQKWIVLFFGNYPFIMRVLSYVLTY